MKSISIARLTVIVHDVLMIPLAWFGAYWLRFNLSPIPQDFLEEALFILPGLLLIQAIAYQGFGLYRGIWRFASMPDLIRIVKAVFVGMMATLIACYLYTHMIHIPRSVFPLYALLLVAFLGGSRLTYRWLKDARGLFPVAERVLVIGAGQAGEALIRDLMRDEQHRYKPVALIDDDRKKLGQDIHGIRVVGQVKDIPAMVIRHRIQLVIIAIPSAKAAKMRVMVEYCEQAGVAFRTLPSIMDLAAGRVSVHALREVSLEDLLNRDPVNLDWEDIRQHLKGKTVVVTGGGGSIGSELCRQIASLHPALLIVIEKSEYNLYELELEFQQKFPNIPLKACLLDVLERRHVADILKQYQPDVIFHAAAYKHVPLLESQVRVAVRNNLLGTRVMAEEAVNAGVQKFVLISTDKAVNPTNIMGASKRAAEIFCQNLSQHADTHFVTVRFGNVLGSTGSVVPLFRRQLQQGGPLTVTHPEITRFFMTAQEAVQLILQAMVMGQGGEIFVLDMGEPVKIRYLAEQMIRLSGRIPGEDIEIHYTGLRPGEKLYEELFHESEALMQTQHDKILLARYRAWDWSQLIALITHLSHACETSDEMFLRELLFQLVPEYQGIQAATIVSDTHNID